MGGGAPATKDDKNTLYCSFCGKSQHEVVKLIAGPGAFICDECVELCVDIVVKEKGTASEGVASLSKLREIRSEIEDAIGSIDKAATPLKIEQAVIGDRLNRLGALQKSLQALLTHTAVESSSPAALPAKPPLES